MSVRQGKVERGGQAVGDRESRQRGDQPPATLCVGAHDEAPFIHEAGDERVLGDRRKRHVVPVWKQGGAIHYSITKAARCNASALVRSSLTTTRTS